MKSHAPLWRMACRHIVAMPIIVYKYAISPFLPQSCRYYPTCSSYAHEAIMTHGIIKGSGLAIWRILRCHPWAEGGIDPVPPKGQAKLGISKVFW